MTDQLKGKRVAALVANDYVTGEIVIADGGLNLT